LELKLDLTRELLSSAPAGTYEDSSRWGSINLGSSAVNFIEETSYLKYHNCRFSLINIKRYNDPAKRIA
jgi:hypothetical protein